MDYTTTFLVVIQWKVLQNNIALLVFIFVNYLDIIVIINDITSFDTFIIINIIVINNIINIIITIVIVVSIIVIKVIAIKVVIIKVIVIVDIKIINLVIDDIIFNVINCLNVIN